MCHISVGTNQNKDCNTVAVNKITISKEKQGSGENYIMRSVMIILTQYCSGDKIWKNEMGGACSTYGRRGEAYTGVWRGNL